MSSLVCNSGNFAFSIFAGPQAGAHSDQLDLSSRLQPLPAELLLQNGREPFISSCFSPTLH